MCSYKGKDKDSPPSPSPSGSLYEGIWEIPMVSDGIPWVFDDSPKDSPFFSAIDCTSREFLLVLTP